MTKTEKIFFPAVLLLAAILILNRLLLVFDQTEDLGGIESVFVYYVLQVLSGTALYSSFNLPPFGDCQYAPLFFESAGNFLSLFYTDHIQLFGKLYVVLRSFNLAVHLAVIFLLLRIVLLPQQTNRFQLLLSFTLLLALFHSHQIAVRPDALKTFWITLSFLAFLRLNTLSSFSFSAALLFALPASLAAFTKQDALLWTFAFCLSGLLFHHRKTWLLTALLTAFFHLLFAAAATFFYGKLFWENLLIGLHFNYSTTYFLSEVFLPALPLLLIQLGGLLYLFLQKKPENRATLFALLTGFLLLTPAACKWGATPVYYQEFFLWTAAVVLHHLFHSGLPNKTGFSFGYLLILAAAMVISGSLPVYDYSHQTQLRELRNEQEQLSQTLSEKYGKSGYYLFTHDRSLIGMNHTRALFPSYETTHPEFLMNSISYGNNRYAWSAAFPNLPDFELCDTNIINAWKPDQPLLLVVPSEKPLPAFSFLKTLRFEPSFQTRHYDVYKNIVP